VIGVAVVGGGLAGLTLARTLHRAGQDVHLFEARGRLGGRIDSPSSAAGISRVDLGPTWYWPRGQPRMTALVDELQLPDFAQHVRDWAREPLTCSARDLREHTPRPPHPQSAHPALGRPYWEGKLWFAGSETSSREAGYLEGALEAAARTAQALGSEHTVR